MANHTIEGLLQPDTRPNPNDAHKFEGRCRFPFCPGYPRAGLLTLVGKATVCATCLAARASGQMRTQGPCGHDEPASWAKPTVTTNSRRDTIEVCQTCAEDFGRMTPDLAAFLPMPIGAPPQTYAPPPQGLPPVAKFPELAPQALIALTALRELARPRPGGWTVGTMMQRAQKALADLGVR